MHDIDMKRGHLSAIDALLTQALVLADEAGEHALAALLSHTLSSASECLERLE